MRTDWTNTKIYSTNKDFVEFYGKLVGFSDYPRRSEDPISYFNSSVGVSYFERNSGIDNALDIRDVTEEVKALYLESQLQEGVDSGVSGRSVEDIVSEAIPESPTKLEIAVQEIQSLLEGTNTEVEVTSERIGVLCMDKGFDGDYVQVQSVSELVEFVEAIKTLQKLGYK
ncbi:hypothetical protein NVP1170O_088 [Vibrio phage 1.170.O._10N.261.52.C3]|nr:hypothetical protein NVP1170O_088 [Vibrio phage 1.170.O._10N.261.52.C3]